MQLAWLPGDLVAGAMLAAIAIPEQIATARLAGMPAQTGLYAFAAGSLAFALFGRNRFLSVGADSTTAPIFAGSIATIVIGSSTPYPALVGLVALFTGLALLLAGVLRAGWIADLLSIPVTIGFLAGIGVHIIVGQLPSVLGVSEGPGPLVMQLVALVGNLPHLNGATLLIGAGVLALTFGAERLSPRIPGALLGLVGASVAVAALHLDRHGVAVLGALPAALPRLGFTFVGVSDALRIAPVGVIVALVCMIQTSVVLRSFPSNPGTQDDPSRDFAAVGAGSIVAALIGAFPVNASPPRTAVVAQSGGRSQLAGIVAVAAAGLLIVFGGRLTADLPLAALGGVLIFVGMRIFRLADMLRITRFGDYEIWLVVAGALLVIVLPIEAGMLFAIVLSLAHGIYIVARPPSTELVRVPGTTIWWPPGSALGEHAPGERVAGVLVFAPAAPITFTNGEYIVRRLRELVGAAAEPVQLVILEGSGVIDVDYTGAHLLCAAIGDLHARDITVALARFEVPRAQSALERTGVIAALGPDRTFKSVHEAFETLKGCLDPTPPSQLGTKPA